MTAPTKLIVLMAFDRDDYGELQPAFEPREMPDEARAKMAAADLKDRHVGVLAWVRDADPALGEFGPPTVLAVYGDVPDMECARRHDQAHLRRSPELGLITNCKPRIIAENERGWRTASGSGQ